MPLNLPLFLFVALVTVATPGPTVLLALSNGSRAGLRGALFGILGAVLSDFLLVGAVALGLGALLLASEPLFRGVKWAGVAYLAFLGIGLLRSRPSPGAPGGDVREAESLPSPGALFAKSLLVALTNPKGYLFFSALLPQFLALDAPQAPQYLLLALLFGGVDFGVMLAYALAGRQARRRGIPGGAWRVDQVCGGVLLALAVSLALVRRRS